MQNYHCTTFWSKIKHLSISKYYNGIPILPYYNNKKDTELIILVNYLKHLFKFDDMRIENRRNIRLELLYIKANNEKSWDNVIYSK